MNPAFPAEARAHGMFSAISVCCVLLPLGVPVGLTSVWAASTNTRRALNPLMGNSRPARGRKKYLKYLPLLLNQKRSADTVGEQAVRVRLCTHLLKLPVYIGLLVCNHLGPVILKRWSLSLPAVLMNAIILLAALGAVQTLWGPCPRNDSDLIKQHKLWLGGRQEIKVFCKYCKRPMTQN